MPKLLSAGAVSTNALLAIILAIIHHFLCVFSKNTTTHVSIRILVIHQHLLGEDWNNIQ